MQVLTVDQMSMVGGANAGRWLAELVLEAMIMGAAEAVIDHQVRHFGGTPDYGNYNAMGDYTGGGGAY